MMNFNSNALHGRHMHKENIPPSSKTAGVSVQRSNQRTVLGVLSENDSYSRSFSEGSHFSRHSSLSDSSQLNASARPSASSYDVCIEETREIVLAASGQEVVVDGFDLDSDSDAPQSEDMRLLLELSLASCQDVSMQSEPDKSLLSDGFSDEYAEDIHRHLRESEVKFRARPYLGRHPEITSGMRCVLVNWLVELVQEFGLHSETLHLAVNYLDRYLSSTMYVKRGKVQLLGTAALLIAAKYEEILAPELSDFVYITDNTYTKKQLIHMEHLLLNTLDFNMAPPTTNQFLRLFMSIQPVCSTTENLALYIAELSLLEIDPFIQYTPSIVAAGAYCLAAYTINKSLWPYSLKAFTGYALAQIVPCLKDLHNLYLSMESRPEQAVCEKYRSSKYSRVSLLPPPAVLPLF